MSISKAVIMGKVVRNPEKRFTTGNLAITTFAIDISNSDEAAIIKIVTMGKLAETVVDTVKKDNIVAIEGRLQTNVTKTTEGTEQKGVEIQAQAVEIVGAAAPQAETEDKEDNISFDEGVVSEDLIGEDEIPF